MFGRDICWDKGLGSTLLGMVLISAGFFLVLVIMNQFILYNSVARSQTITDSVIDGSSVYAQTFIDVDQTLLKNKAKELVEANRLPNTKLSINQLTVEDANVREGFTDKLISISLNFKSQTLFQAPNGNSQFKVNSQAKVLALKAIPDNPGTVLNPAVLASVRTMLLGRYGDIPGTEMAKKIEPEIEEYLVRLIMNELEEKVAAQLVWGEDRQFRFMERAGVLWCVLNRVELRHSTVYDVSTAPMQFTGYKPGNPTERWAIDLVRDVAVRYVLEKVGIMDAGRVLPADYEYFHLGRGGHNDFRKVYNGWNNLWGWTLPDPYGQSRDWRKIVGSETIH